MSWARWTSGAVVQPVDGVLSLGGDRGFTLEGFAQFFPFGGSQCFGISTTCLPGTPISLGALTGGSDMDARATLDGVFYSHTRGTCPDGLGPCGFASIAFSGQVVVPPFGGFTKAILKTPVSFSGSFSHFDSFSEGGFGSEQLVASAIATLTLDKIENSGFPPAWRSESIRYELQSKPVPDPATLLLLGASGVAVAWWKRRQR